MRKTKQADAEAEGEGSEEAAKTKKKLPLKLVVISGGGAAGGGRRGKCQDLLVVFFRMTQGREAGHGAAAEAGDLRGFARGAGRSHQSRQGPYPVSEGEGRLEVPDEKLTAADPTDDAADDGRIPDLPARAAPDRPRRFGGTLPPQGGATRRVNSAITPKVPITAVLFKENGRAVTG